MCPVTAFLAYMAVRGGVDGPLFRCALTKQDFINKLRKALLSLGLRNRGATTAAEVGLEDSTIKLLERWESNAFHTYIKTPRTQLAALSARLLGNSRMSCLEADLPRKQASRNS